MDNSQRVKQVPQLTLLPPETPPRSSKPSTPLSRLFKHSPPSDKRRSYLASSSSDQAGSTSLEVRTEAQAPKMTRVETENSLYRKKASQSPPSPRRKLADRLGISPRHVAKRSTTDFQPQKKDNEEHASVIPTLQVTKNNYEFYNESFFEETERVIRQQFNSLKSPDHSSETDKLKFPLPTADKERAYLCIMKKRLEQSAKLCEFIADGKKDADTYKNVFIDLSEKATNLSGFLDELDKVKLRKDIDFSFVVEIIGGEKVLNRFEALNNANHLASLFLTPIAFQQKDKSSCPKIERVKPDQLERSLAPDGKQLFKEIWINNTVFRKDRKQLTTVFAVVDEIYKYLQKETFDENQRVAQKYLIGNDLTPLSALLNSMTINFAIHSFYITKMRVPGIFRDEGFKTTDDHDDGRVVKLDVINKTDHEGTQLVRHAIHKKVDGDAKDKQAVLTVEWKLIRKEDQPIRASHTLLHLDVREDLAWPELEGLLKAFNPKHYEPFTFDEESLLWTSTLS